MSAGNIILLASLVAFVSYVIGYGFGNQAGKREVVNFLRARPTITIADFLKGWDKK